jgi:hypothetical protein
MKLLDKLEENIDKGGRMRSEIPGNGGER